MPAFCNVTPCSLAETDRHFGGSLLPPSFTTGQFLADNSMTQYPTRQPSSYSPTWKTWNLTINHTLSRTNRPTRLRNVNNLSDTHKHTEQLVPRYHALCRCRMYIIWSSIKTSSLLFSLTHVENLRRCSHVHESLRPSFLSHKLQQPNPLSVECNPHSVKTASINSRQTVQVEKLNRWRLPVLRNTCN
jgi:hypothetical protein